MKTILKLAIVALLANATWHVFEAYSPNFKFKDSIDYVTLHRGQISDEQLSEKILELAAQFEVPVTEANVTVTHEGKRTRVHVAYVRTIELVPGFKYPWPFSFVVESIQL